MLLRIAHPGTMLIVMVDSPSDQKSFVRFRARPIHTVLHHPSASCITFDTDAPIKIEGSSVYTLVHMLLVTLPGRRMSNSVPVVVLRGRAQAKHKQS